MTALEERALALSEHFLPKVNYGASFLDAKAIEAVNLFECEIEKLRRMARIETTEMCSQCNHPVHSKRCTEDAPNAQFRCACPGDQNENKD